MPLTFSDKMSFEVLLSSIVAIVGMQAYLDNSELLRQ
jgi:hypothetical protein